MPFKIDLSLSSVDHLVYIIEFSILVSKIQPRWTWASVHQEFFKEMPRLEGKGMQKMLELGWLYFLNEKKILILKQFS